MGEPGLEQEGLNTNMRIIQVGDTEVEGKPFSEILSIIEAQEPSPEHPTTMIFRLRTDNKKDLNDLTDKLVGDPETREKCFENIWEHDVFEQFGGPSFRDDLLSGKVEHDEDIMEIIDENVNRVFKQGALPAQFDRQKPELMRQQKSLGVRRRRLYSDRLAARSP